MSTQNKGLPFYNAPESCGFRLIEIPPEVEALLEGPNPQALHLDSDTDDMAIIRTPEHTYKLKQKNTSNGLFLIKPYTPDEASPEQGVAAIATIKETVELERVNKAAVSDPTPKTKSVGKWHERFGRAR